MTQITKTRGDMVSIHRVTVPLVMLGGAVLIAVSTVLWVQSQSTSVAKEIGTKIDNFKTYVNNEFGGMRDKFESKVDDLRNKVFDLATAIAVIQGNRFTSQDAGQLQQEIAALWKSISELDKRFDEEVPPDWFKEQVERIGEQVKILQKIVSELEKSG